MNFYFKISDELTILARFNNFLTTFEAHLISPSVSIVASKLRIGYAFASVQSHEKIKSKSVSDVATFDDRSSSQRLSLEMHLCTDQ